MVDPLAPLVLYGRFAKRDPPCHKQECVYYFWRDRPCLGMIIIDRRQFLDVNGSHCAVALIMRACFLFPQTCKGSVHNLLFALGSHVGEPFAPTRVSVRV